VSKETDASGLPGEAGMVTAVDRPASAGRVDVSVDDG